MLLTLALSRHCPAAADFQSTLVDALDLTDRLLSRLEARSLKPELLPFFPYTAPQSQNLAGFSENNKAILGGCGSHFRKSVAARLEAHPLFAQAKPIVDLVVRLAVAFMYVPVRAPRAAEFLVWPTTSWLTTSPWRGGLSAAGLDELEPIEENDNDAMVQAPSHVLLDFAEDDGLVANLKMLPPTRDHFYAAALCVANAAAYPSLLELWSRECLFFRSLPQRTSLLDRRRGGTMASISGLRPLRVDRSGRGNAVVRVG